MSLLDPFPLPSADSLAAAAACVTKGASLIADSDVADIGKDVDKNHGIDLSNRYPLYLGHWKRSIPGIDESFAHDDMDEPHIKRKQVIIAKYPQIKTLYGPEPSTKYLALTLVIVQLCLTYLFGRIWTQSTVYMVLVCYLVSAPITQVRRVRIE